MELCVFVCVKSMKTVVCGVYGVVCKDFEDSCAGYCGPFDMREEESQLWINEDLMAIIAS